MTTHASGPSSGARSHPIAAAIGFAVVGAAAFVLALVLCWGLRPTLRLTFNADKGPDRFVFRGFGAFDHSTSWTTSPEASIVLRGLDRARDLSVAVTVGGDRPRPPILAVRADDRDLGSRQLAGGQSVWQLTIPRRTQQGLTLQFDVSDLFQPDSGDVARGVLLESVTIRPRGWWWPPRALLLQAAEVGALFGAASGLVEIPGMAIAIGLLIAAAVSAAISQVGIAAFTSWQAPATDAARAALAVGLAGAISLGAGRGRAYLPIAQCLVLSCALLWLDLSFLLHPEVTDGDVWFHMHRLTLVENGTYLFTSAGPGGAFPYPVAFYAVAAWFKAPGIVWQTGVPLRVLAAVVDATAGCLLACAVWRVWRRAAIALLVVIAYHLAPAEYQVHAIAYLTNPFGHSLSVMALASLCLGPPVTAALLAVPWTVGAFLSHTGTFVSLGAILSCAVVVEVWRRGPNRWTRSLTTLGVLVTATIVSVAVYYRHFGPVYHDLLTRPPAVVSTLPLQRAEAHQTAWVPGWPALKQRLGAAPGYVQKYWGWPLLTLAIAGLWHRRRHDDAMMRLLRAWLIACAGLFALGQFTPVDVRYYLAAAPALAVLASSAAVDGALSTRWKWPTLVTTLLFLAQALWYRFEWFTSVPR